MYPILVSIGSFHLYNFGVFLVIAWITYSFLFWRTLRAEAVPEEKIFDLMFYATLSAFVFGRAWFVATHWSLFANNSLKIVAIWVQPGLSLYGGLVAAILTLLALSKRRVRVGLVLDSLALSLPWALIVGAVGSLLDGSEVGIKAHVPWSIHYVGIEGARHPVQLYEIVALLSIGLVSYYYQKRAKKQSWPYGLVGVWFFLLFSVSLFIIEFFKESSVYLRMLSANQWILIAFFAEALGAFYVRGGGREKLRPFLHRIYDRFSKRHPQ